MRDSTNRFVTALAAVVILVAFGVWIGGDPRLAPARAEAQSAQSPLYVILMTATPAPTATPTQAGFPNALTMTPTAIVPVTQLPPTPTKVPPLATATKQPAPSPTAPTAYRDTDSQQVYVPLYNLRVRTAPGSVGGVAVGAFTGSWVYKGSEQTVYVLREYSNEAVWGCIDAAVGPYLCSRWIVITDDLDGDGALEVYAQPKPGPVGQ